MTKILLVEDDKSLREIYGVRLLAEGYDIISAGDGEEALAMAIKERPALILSDVMMPKISGFDMLDILRSTTETKNIKVIMMTALSSEDQRARGEALGADRYLVKSQVGIEDVVRTVHDILSDAPAGSAPVQQTTSTRSTTPVPVPSRPGTPATAAQPSVPGTTPPPAIPPSPTIEQLSPPASPAASSVNPAAVAATLPQPTAPFSTQRPANLGDRVIQPLTNLDEDTEAVARRMAAELSDGSQPSGAVPMPSTVPNAQTPQPPAPPVFPPATPAPDPVDTPIPVAKVSDQLSPQEQLVADEAALAASLKLDDSPSPAVAAPQLQTPAPTPPPNSAVPPQPATPSNPVAPPATPPQQQPPATPPTPQP